MSRIGRLPINIPNGVNVTIDESLVSVSGAKGKLSQSILQGIKIIQENDVLRVNRDNESKLCRSNHGLMRTLVNNMVTGVTEGFNKKLEINGVGYKVSQQGSSLKFNLGYSHDIIYNLPQGIEAQLEQNTITISGIDKQQVGQVASEIRKLRKPEPYKGKGIRYQGEYVIRKSGKSGKEK